MPNTSQHLDPSTPRLFDTQECRELRKRIQAHRIKRLGWSDFVFHYVLNGLGYGTSLTALSYEQLNELWNAIANYRKSGLPYEFTLDKWGNYMFALQKKAGWDDATLRAYLLLTYQKSHWNLLSYDEKKATITLLQSLPPVQQDANPATPPPVEQDANPAKVPTPPIEQDANPANPSTSNNNNNPKMEE